MYPSLKRMDADREDDNCRQRPQTTNGSHIQWAMTASSKIQTRPSCSLSRGVFLFNACILQMASISVILQDACSSNVLEYNIQIQCWQVCSEHKMFHKCSCMKTKPNQHTYNLAERNLYFYTMSDIRAETQGYHSEGFRD